MIGIYKITSPSGKTYIGSSIDIEKRIKYYNSISCRLQTRLYHSIKKYGWAAHKLEIIEECPIEKLYMQERYYGELYNVLGENGLNCILPNIGEQKSVGVSDETRMKMSLSKKGEKNTFFGKTHNQKTKDIISKIQTGRKHTKEHRLKVSQNHARAKAKLVINLETGIFYESCTEAAQFNNVKLTTLKSRLNGNNRNNTPFRYCEKLAS